MSVSIISCPSCSTMLLSDTIQCPSCRHVLDPERAAAMAELFQQNTSPESSRESPCPNCQEMVRHGLVRCWNCGTFMKQEIEKTFQKMQEAPSPVIYSQLPGKKKKSGTASSDSTAPPNNGHPGDDATSASDASVRTNLQSNQGDSEFAEDEDFELAPEYVASDDDFDLQPGLEVQEPRPAPPDRSHQSADPSEPPPLPASAVAEQSDTSEQPGEVDNSTEEAYSLKSSDASDAATSQSSEDASQDDAKPDRSPPKPPEEPHSIATGGDVLLQVALEEEAESKKRRKRGGRRLRNANGFLVYCPYGHRIEVQDKHRGKVGRCPKCQSRFTVPLKALDEVLEQKKTPAENEPKSDEAATPSAPPALQELWLTDIPVHPVDPQKLKLKPGSLAQTFDAADLRFTPDGLLVAFLVKKKGLFGGADKKKQAAAREAVQAHLAEDKPLDELPAAEHLFFPADQLGELRVVQPAPYAHESLFAGIPVFGEGRIAVRFPVPGPDVLPKYASFYLSEFRQVSASLAEYCGIEDFGQESGVPLTDEFTELTCHYSDEPLRVLEEVTYHRTDPQVELKLIGRRCQGCGLVVSEDSRKKEKIGGSNGRGIAKAKCPKCQQKFGDISLYTVEAPIPETSESAPPNEGTTAS